MRLLGGNLPSSSRRERVLDALLNRPLERTCAKDRIKPYFSQFRQGSVGDNHFQIHFFQTLLQQAQLDLGDGRNVGGIQPMEDHGFVDTVQEFGAEIQF